MAGKMLTLYEECLRKIAGLLQISYWNPDLPPNQNPFALLPSAIVDTLIIYIAGISSSRKLRSNLRLLVSSGQVRNFIFADDNLTLSLLPPGLLARYDHDVKFINLDKVKFEMILTDLSCCCHNLVSLKINHSSFFSFDAYRSSLDQLLKAATNIRNIECPIDVNPKSLSNCSKLEKLVINTIPHGSLSDISDFLKVNEEYKFLASLKHIEVGEGACDLISYKDLAVILKYCPELISINHDISRALQYLHTEEFHNGTLCHKYQLQKFDVGFPHRFSDEYDDENCEFSGRVGALIASLTCPHLVDLNLWLRNGEFISAFSDSKNLRKLRVGRFPAIYYEDYDLELRSFLEHPNIGRNLKHLEINTFINVDFLSIGSFCPNLEALKIYNAFSEISSYECKSVAFQKLKVLQLSKLRGDDEFNSAVGLISKSTNLEELDVGIEFSDNVLDEVFKENSLSKLKKLSLRRCSLSLKGLRNLARKLTALERVALKKSNMTRHEILRVFRSINPKVEVKINVLT